jgi:diaminopimelate epimerase
MADPWNTGPSNNGLDPTVGRPAMTPDGLWKHPPAGQSEAFDGPSPMRFHKYQALGNDYLVLEYDPASRPSSALVQRLCDRHYGVGSDGILVAGPDSDEGFALRIFNPDGSEAEKSGNGLRIFARYLWDIGRVNEEPFHVLTKGGLVRCRVQDDGGEVTVDMGEASFDSTKIPVTGPRRDVVSEELRVGGEVIRFTGVTVGNPHCVIHAKDVAPGDAMRLGPLLERHGCFPNRTNVQFVEVIDRNRIKIEIWERGAGYTLASGSSSCAAAAASVRLGLCAGDVTVVMPGGELSILVSSNFSIRMTGPAAKIAEGSLSTELVREAVEQGVAPDGLPQTAARR